MRNQILFYIVILLTNIIHGITGFAGTILAMPPSLMLVGYDIAKPILNVLAIFSGVYVFVGNYKKIAWKELAKIVVVMALGIFGAVFIKGLFVGKEHLLYKLLGLLVIGLSVQGFYKLVHKPDAKTEPPAEEQGSKGNVGTYALLVLAGIIHGLFVSGGPLLTGYMTKRIKDKTVFRATISTVWVFLNTLVFLEDVQAGLWVPSTVKMLATSVPFLLAGMFIGSKLVARMSQLVFMKLTYILLFISGLLLPAMIALIALTQVVQKLRDFKVAGGKLDDARKIDKQGITKKEMVSILPACLRSSTIASVLGAMPGVGGGVAQFLCYNEVRRTSKHPEEFGKGCLEGIAAAESSNNAVVGSAMIPLLTLGIPGDGVTALLLGAFVLHGIQPGPTMFTKQGVMAYTIIIGCLVANVLLAPLGLGMTRLVAKIVQVRYTYLAPVIIMFCFAGAFAATGNTKELIICAGILIFSYILTVLDIDNTPLMLGMILEDIMEQNFVTASMSYDRNYSIFITRPISAVILIITVVLLVSMIRVNRRVAKLNEQQEAQMAAEHAKMENA